MKLHAKEKPVTVSNMESNNYHCCRWCKWCVHNDHDEWRCTNPCYGGVVDSSFVGDIVESGTLNDTLNEALHSVPTAREEFAQGILSVLRNWGVSARRVKEMEKTFNECLDQFLDMGLREEIDSQVSSLLYNHAESLRIKSLSSDSGTVLEDPFTHYCREFW